MRNEKGAAMIEFILTVGILILLWTALYNYASIYAIKQRLAVGTRYAAWVAKDKKNEVATLLAIKHYTGGPFVKREETAISVRDEGLTVIYKTGTAVAEAETLAKTIPGAPPVLVREKYYLSGDSWMVKDHKKEEKKYREQFQRGELEKEGFKIWREHEKPVNLSGFD